MLQLSAFLFSNSLQNRPTFHTFNFMLFLFQKTEQRANKQNQKHRTWNRFTSSGNRSHSEQVIKPGIFLFLSCIKNSVHREPKYLAEVQAHCRTTSAVTGVVKGDMSQEMTFELRVEPWHGSRHLEKFYKTTLESHSNEDESPDTGKGLMWSSTNKQEQGLEQWLSACGSWPPENICIQWS